MPAVTPTSVGAVDTPDVLPVDQATAIAATQSYAQESLDARDLARNWATKTTGEVVAGQGYGAKKYAQDAANSVIEAQGALDTSVALAHDWATKTASEVVTGQGFGAKKYAQDAAASLSAMLTKLVGAFATDPTYVGGSPPWVNGARYYNTLSGKERIWRSVSGTYGWHDYDEEVQTSTSLVQQIAVGFSADDYTINGVSALKNGAVISVPKGLLVLNGNNVARSDLLLLSSGAKNVFGPNGDYQSVGANTMALDFSAGYRTNLHEANGATNLVTTPEDISTAWTAGRTSASVAANALYGIFSLTTLTSLGAIPDNRVLGQQTFSGNRTIVMSIALLASNGGNPAVGIYDTASAGYGSNSVVAARVKRGPGAAAVQSNGLVYTSGLSATVPTEFEVVRTFAGSPPTTAYSILYALWTAAGQIIKAGMPHHEDNVLSSSSYITNNAPRPPDVLTPADALKSMILGQNSTTIIRAKLLAGDSAASWIYQLLGDDKSSMLYVDNANFGLYVWDSYSTKNLASYFPTSTPAVDIGVAITTTKDGRRKICINGGPVVQDNKSQYSADASALTFFGGSVAYRSNVLLKEIVQTAAYCDSDDALRAHARPYP